MDDKGEIVSSVDVDENLTLQIWTKGLSPRLVVFNKNKNSRKLIHLSWLEKRDRKLSIKGKKRMETFSYAIEDFSEMIEKLLLQYVVYTNFRPKLWKFAVDLEKKLHVPEIITDKGELNLLPEDKRSSLWIADITGDNKKEGEFCPFFPRLPEEDVVLTDKLFINDNARTVQDLFKTGVVRQLAKVRPLRWHNPLRVTAVAMLLGFSYCDADGSDFVDILWRGEDEPQRLPGAPKPEALSPVAFTIRDPRLLGLGHKLIAYIRHFDALEDIGVRVSMDSDKELSEQGFARKRRLSFPDGTVGDVAYSVTFFDDENGNMALGCKPKAATARHQGELIYTFSATTYDKSLTDDTMGGPPDDFFSVTQLVWARQFSDWYNSVAHYVAPFAGLL